MVFIRLIVKVYPREQLSRPFPTPNRKPTEPETKPASFLLALPNPEAITLGQLAGLIRSKWTKLRPNAEPLDIKKLLDDNRDTVDLDVDMTVADVWVNQARARRNEDDQVGTVRVVQRPAPYAPVRFPSVDQDWGVSREERFTGKFETIEEARESETGSETGSGSGSDEDSEEGSEESESEKENLIDAQAVAVNGEDDAESETDESEEEESGSEEDEDEQANGRANAEESADEGESEEEPAPDNDVHMEDSLPETRVLKRKMSPEELEPKKQPRLEQSSQATEADGDNVNRNPVSSPLGTRKRDADRAPSFSGLGRRLSFTERPALSHGLGLGITKSPPRKKPFLMADLFQDSTRSETVPKDARLSPTTGSPSSAPAIRRTSVDQHPATPAKLQTPADKVRLLQSALRKDSPAERSPERRSVSFAEGEDHAIPTSARVTRPTLQATNKEQKHRTNSSSKPAPPGPEERSDEEENQSEDKEEEGMEFSSGINTEINEYERELQSNDLDQKSEYTRKLKLATKKWQIMKNNENSNRKRQRERYNNAHNDLKVLHREVVELKEFNQPPSQRPKSQTPNGTPGTRKLSRDPASSQNRKSQAPWDVEIVTPRPNSKKLVPKSLPSSQISRKSPEREQARDQKHWSVEIPTPKADSSPEKRPEPRKPSQERPPSPLSESESEQSDSEEEESTPKQPEPKKPSSEEKPPSLPAESVSEEDSSSEEEDNAAPNQPDSLIESSPAVEVSVPKPVPKPVPEPGSDSEQQSGSAEEEEEDDDEDEDEEEEEDEDEEEEAKAEEKGEKDKSTEEESQNEDDNKPEEKEGEIVPETEEERELETTTPAVPNSPPTETPSKPDPAAEETDSDTDESESDQESDKENQALPKPTPTTKAGILRRTSLNPPSSQPNAPSSSQPQPSSTQSTPTGSRPTRNTLKTLLFQQRAEQAQARLKKEEEAAKRKSQPRRDIFSGPSDTESEDEDDSESDSESDSGADAGDILSTGSVGKLRTALPRK
ncbi:conserved serine-rich protein [Aspergillus bombycis]|uniref:Conserved serine-rich protein n=1 Tax=Aspergillus bombycis TaxID=109264 RepID=A0A1F7ZTP6_9EURO|nr:conserved serine-rich protein [Aspergillus bombycis]OGM42826.1 conserved serine-rich protein [Aspergillus bombycis]